MRNRIASFRLLVVLLGAVATARAGNAQGRPHLVQSVDLQVPAAPRLVRIAGGTHLVYELHVTNFRPVDVELTRVEVFDASRNVPLAELRDSALSKLLARPGTPADLPNKRLIGAGMRAVVFLWLSLDDALPTPTKLRHTIELDLVRPTGREHAVVEGGSSDVGRQTAIVLDPPLRRGPWVALYDPAMAGGHRTSVYTLDGRARIPARFAIDWVRLGDDASHARGDASVIANWHGYGADVLAVADGIVAAAMDDMTESPSISEKATPIALENASGNYVTLDLGGGRYAFYEHLKHGSVRVKAGDRVKRGQAIAQLGNSGSSSSGPHLHFHLADASADLAAEGIPFVFRNFDVIGAFETIGGFATGEQWKPAMRGADGRRRLELPSANSVVIFR